MFGVTTIAIAYLIVSKLEKSSQYKQPKGKHKNRYK